MGRSAALPPTRAPRRAIWRERRILARRANGVAEIATETRLTRIRTIEDVAPPRWGKPGRAFAECAQTHGPLPGVWTLRRLERPMLRRLPCGPRLRPRSAPASPLLRSYPERTRPQ